MNKLLQNYYDVEKAIMDHVGFESTGTYLILDFTKDWWRYSADIENNIFEITFYSDKNKDLLDYDELMSDIFRGKELSMVIPKDDWDTLLILDNEKERKDEEES